MYASHTPLTKLNSLHSFVYLISGVFINDTVVLCDLHHRILVVSYDIKKSQPKITSGISYTPIAYASHTPINKHYSLRFSALFSGSFIFTMQLDLS